MMLDTLGVGMSDFRPNAKALQKVKHDVMAMSHFLGQRPSALGQKNGAIRPRRDEA